MLKLEKYLQIETALYEKISYLLTGHYVLPLKRPLFNLRKPPSLSLNP